MTRRILRCSLLLLPTLLFACDGGDGGDDAGTTETDSGVVTEQDAGVTPPTVTISDAEAVEGDAGTTKLTFAVTISKAPAQTVSVAFATLEGTAKSDDFQSAQGTLEFTAADPVTKNVEVLVAGDDLYEDDETFTLQLLNPVGLDVIDPTGTGTIKNDDPVPAISTADMSAGEGDGQLVFKVELTNPSSQTITVDFAATDGGTATSSDFTATAATLTFAPGDVSASAIVPVTSDLLDEDDETVELSLSAPTHATISDATAIGTITDDDATPGLSINDTSVVEGDTGTATATFTVTLSAASGRLVTVDWATASGTATSGTDFVAGSGSLSFAPGQTSKTLTVSVNGELTYEPNETFTVTLTNAVNATLPNSPGTGTINNDDLPIPSISVSDASALEGLAGGSPLTFTVSLSAAYNKTITVDYGAIEGTAKARGLAQLGDQDFTPSSGTLTFAPGDTSKTFVVNALGDVIYEPNETFTVVIGNEQNAILGDSVGVGTIQNDETMPYISFVSNTVTEANSGSQYVQFGVSSDRASSLPFTVDFATSDETATVADNDYHAVSGTVTFEPGMTQYPILVPVNNDTRPEGNEIFRLIGSNAVGATLGQFYVGAFIYNDDTTLPTVSISDGSILEGNAGNATMSFVVSLSKPSGQTVTVGYGSSDGTATAPSDFTAVNGTLTIPAGQTTASILVFVNGDTVAEADEYFQVSLSGPTNAAFGTASLVGTGVIRADDALGPSLTISDVSVIEADSGAATATLTVSLSAASTQTAAVDYVAVGVEATSGVDFTPTSGTLTFSPGQTAQTIQVPILGDVGDEANETIRVQLFATPNHPYVLTDDIGVITINDNDPTPGLSITNATATEGAPLNFTVALSAASAREVTVLYTLADGTAVHSVTRDTAYGTLDYQYGSGTVTFAPGQTSQTLAINTFYDQVFEGGNETMTVTLTNAAGASITGGTATGTIIDDEPTPTLTLNDGIVPAEGRFGRSYMMFTVQMSRRVQTPVTVDYAATSGTATLGTDFDATSGTLTFAPGETTKPIIIPVVGDPTVEPDETLTLTISNPTAPLTMTKSVGTGTIVNDD